MKKNIAEELHRFFLYAIFLYFFFGAFSLYQELTLHAEDITYLHYEFEFLEALMLSKIILVGQALKLGERYRHRPLIVTTLYKTIIFSSFVFVFSIVEHFLVGFIRGRSFAALYDKLVTTGIDEILAKLLVMSFFFLIFFAFLETSRALGKDVLYNLFFKRRK